jgi:hypothetical protein
VSRRERTVGESGPGTTTAADAITIEHAEASRDSGRRDDPVPADRPINMNHAGISSIDDSGVLRQDSLLRSAELCGLGGSVMDLLDCAEDHRRGALHGPAHQVPWAVAIMYLGEPPFDRHGLAVRACGHVTEGQHAGRYVRCGLELGTQDIGESAFADFDDGARMVGDQPAQHGIGVLRVAQVPGAIELMQAGDGEAGGVADVVQPRGGLHQLGVRAENRCQAACPRCDALDVRPAAGQGLLEEFPGELLRP